MRTVDRLCLVLIAAAAGSAAGCGVRPAQICHEFFGEWQAAIDRCALTDPTTGEPLRFEPYCERDPSIRLSCDNANGVSNQSGLQSGCYPWLRSVTCPDLVEVLSGRAGAPASCDVRFTILEC